MTSSLRRTALAAGLALALTQADAASVDTRAALSAHRQDAAAIAVSAANPNLVLLRAGAYDPAVQRLDAGVTGGAESLSAGYAIVQFTPDQVEAGRKALLAQGAEIVGYVPNNAFYVRLNGKSLDALRQASGARAAEPYAAALKVDPRLWTDARGTLLQQQPEDATDATLVLDIVDIRGFRGESSEAIEAALRKLVPDVRITGRSQRAEAAPYVHAGVTRDRLDHLLYVASLIDGVSFIEPWIPTHTHNSAAIGAIQGNSLNTTCAGNGVVCGPAPLFDHGLFGTGQIVAVADSGTSPWVANFTTLDKGTGPLTEITLSQNPPPVLPNAGTLFPNRKIVGYWLQPSQGGTGPVDYDYTSGHGTHTTGTVLGDLHGTFGASTYVASTPTAANHEQADGMAPNAQLLMQDIGGTAATAVYITDFAGTLSQAYAGGARIHNNSWGGSTAGNYNGNDAEADSVTWRDENLLVVVSAGNDDAGPVQTGSPSNAKNVLSVAALGRAGSTSVAGYSNRGPAADGRIKPDIATPGTSIQSARNATTFSATPVYTTPASNSGTSMAAPVLSGNAALMRQFFADGFYPRGEKTAADAYNPSGMVMKATLLNGTNPLGGTGWPNANSGWGRAWIDGNLWFKNTMTGGDDSRRLRVFERTQATGLKTGDTHEYTIANVAAGTELRVTLAWFDPEASEGVAMTLINNLDLEVVGPGGTYKGNVFTGGISTTGGNADVRDSVEQVRLTAPAAGSYTLRVKGTAIPGNGRAETNVQGYALVASGGFGLPDPAPFAAPTAVAVTSNNTSGIAVGFTSAAAPQGFQLYRADGTCAAAASGDFRLVASGNASPVVDTRSQGGRSYAYKVRGVSGDVEGAVSTCVDVVSADDCTLQPNIVRNSLQLNAANNSCSVNLSWQAGTNTCPSATSTTYKIYRSTDPFMATSTLIQSGVTGTSYVDTTVQGGTTYYYRFQATDNLGNDSPLSLSAGATPTSALGPNPDPFVDNADGASYMRPEQPWGISNLSASQGTLSYHTGGQLSNHPDMACASIETPALTIPANGVLSFNSKYNLEFQWDGVVTEISTNGGTTWTDLPPDGGYPTVFNTGTTGVINACGFANGKGIYSGVTTTTSNAFANNDTGVAVFKPFTINLASYAGQTVKVRWRLSSDPGLNYPGMFLDEIRISNSAILFRDGFDPSQYMCQ
ncbi:S8 family serine peptidase [Dokdonella sp. MW10]|uniref:S8 family serine peptidase n=1 Tax=Dokdonella sp. MW10 TaxID=2992926 RepID=UPI003F817CC3